MGIEQFHQLREIRQRAGQPVDFICDHIIHPACPDIGEEALEIWAVQGTSHGEIWVKGKINYT